MCEDEYRAECRELMWEYLREVVEEQIDTGVPAATGETFNRLIRQGHAPAIAKLWIGNVVLLEIVKISPKLNHEEPPAKLYGEAFEERLNRLPGGTLIWDN